VAFNDVITLCTETTASTEGVNRPEASNRSEIGVIKYRSCEKRLMTVSVDSTSFHVLDLDRRMPFHFGNVEVTHDPQLFLEINLVVDDEDQRGVAMGGLIPSWFFRDPSMAPAEGFRAMVSVFRSAADIARDIDPKPTPFDLWYALYERQRKWAMGTDSPPLLWSYGVSLVEQAVLDAYCRHRELSFGEAVRNGELGIDLGTVYEELRGEDPGALLPETPRRRTAIRHTVGLSDPLTDADMSSSDRLDDGLPHTLTDYVHEDGVDHFKIKLSGELERDAQRLERIGNVLHDLGLTEYRCTLDANEGYSSAHEFKQQWTAHQANPDLTTVLDRVAYVEQPLQRDDAFADETESVLVSWEDAPPIIIDESDDRLRNARRALDYGYAGTSHKNCKGVFKGVINACLMASRNRREEKTHVISAEDLTTVGPIELQQDFAVAATIGANHVERNGHHYFQGLSAFPESVQTSSLHHHSDLYRRYGNGFVAVAIDNGTVNLASTVDAPFGVRPLYDTTQFTPLEDWLHELGS